MNNTLLVTDFFSLIVSIIVTPFFALMISAIIMIGTKIIVMRVKQWEMPMYLLLMLSSAVYAILSIWLDSRFICYDMIFANKILISRGAPIQSWFFQLNAQLLLWGNVYFLIGYLIYLYINYFLVSKEKAQGMEKIEFQRMLNIAKKNDINLNTTEHGFVCGTTGSGKTANVLKFVVKFIQENLFTVVIEGKGTSSKFSYHNIMKIYCKLTGRKLYILDQTSPSASDQYNPFKGITDPTQIKDMLIEMSIWSEEHYKLKASRYWQVMAECMIKGELEISFEEIVYYSKPTHFLDLLKELVTKRIISKEDQRYYMGIITDNSETIDSASNRLAVYYDGIGKQIFGKGEEAFSIASAYEENAVVLIKLNKFKYGDFAVGVGKLALEDIKASIDIKLQKQDSKLSLVALDEVSVYFSDIIVDILNKGREVNIKCICSTQSIADLDKISPETRRQVIENCNTFVVMRLNDSVGAEVMADIIGTQKTYQMTAQTELGRTTGTGTAKYVDEYIVNPNTIKQLPNLVGIYFEKGNYLLYPFQTRFVEIPKE